MVLSPKIYRISSYKNRLIMIWHKLPELPKPDTEVLAEVGHKKGNFTYLMVLEYFNESLWRHRVPHSDGLFTWSYILSGLVKRWAYIEEQDSKEDVGVAESPSKTFPRVNEFETGASYRH